MARYAFDEGTGAILNDASGHGNDGTIHGATWTTTTVGHRLRFGRTASYVDCGDNPNLKTTGDMTAAAWVKLMANPCPNPETNWHIFCCEEYRRSGFTLRVSGANGLLYYRSSQPDSFQDLYSATKISNNTYHHVAAVKRGGTITLFVDGSFDAQSSVRDPAPGPAPFTISERSQSFEGLIDDMRVYRRALTLEEIVGLYKEGAGRRGKDTSSFGKFGVVPYFYFDQKKAMLEVDFKGILPLEEGDEVSVELGPPGQKAIEVRSVPEVPANGKKDFDFALEKLPDNAYEIRVALKNKAVTKTQISIPFHYPPLPVKVVSPQDRTVAPLAPLPTPLRYEIEVCKGGGFLVHYQGNSYPIESSYSFPNGGENRLLASESPDDKGETAWNVRSEKVNASTYRVTAQGKHYAIKREIRLEPTRIMVRDDIANLGGDDLGIILSNAISLRGKEGMKPYPLPAVLPMLFLNGRGHGIGMVALDDVYRVQQKKNQSNDRYGIGSDKFALPAKASYALEWAIYPRGSEDFYDFLNVVRKDEGLDNRTIDGFISMSHAGRWLREPPPKDLVECSGLKYASSGCVTHIADDRNISVEGFEFIEYPLECQALKKTYLEAKRLYPHLKVMFHVAPHLRVTNNPDGLYADSRMLDKFGKHSLYDTSEGWFSAERVKQGWAWYPYYPTLDNSFGKAMLKSVDTMMDEIGTNGVFADGLLSGYGARDTYDGFTYDRWDNHSAEIDPTTKTINRKMASVYLLSREAMIAYVRKVNVKGGRVIVNEMNLIPRTFCKENTFFDAETLDGDHRCAQIYLAPTVIGLAQPNLSGNELDVYRDMRSKLSWGALYAYYHWSCSFTHRMITAEMYPITVEEIHPGTLRGKERLITLHSGVYGWRGNPDLHLAYLADGRGVLVPSNFLTTVDNAGVRTEIVLKTNETAVLKRIPVRLQTTAPVNLVGEQYDQQGIRLSLNGSGKVNVTINDGDFRIKPNTLYTVTADRVFTVKSDGKGRLSFSLQLKGQVGLAVSYVP